MNESILGITLDPEGFVVIHFLNEVIRGEFVRKCVPYGEPFQTMRPSDDGLRLSWKLSDMKNVNRLFFSNALINFNRER